MISKSHDSGIYALFIENPKDMDLKVGSLGLVHFPWGYYVYIGSAQKNLRKRIERHYSKEKKMKWHIDYFLQHAYLVGHFYLELPKSCEEQVAIEMAKREKFIKNFGSSDSKAKSHLFYGSKDIWGEVKRIMYDCTRK